MCLSINLFISKTTRQKSEYFEVANRFIYFEYIINNNDGNKA